MSQQAPSRGDTDVIGARIGAQLVDTVIMVALFFAVTFVFGGVGGATGSDGAAGGMAFLGLIFGFIASLVYGFLLEGMWDGYTVGKRLFGIKVVKEDGTPCDLGSAFVRNLLEIIDGLFYYLIGFLAMAFSDKRQRIGDRLAGTIVVRDTSVVETTTSQPTTESQADV